MTRRFVLPQEVKPLTPYSIVRADDLQRLPPPMTTKLEVLADLILALTYEEMVTLARGIHHREEDIHAWAKRYVEEQPWLLEGERTSRNMR